MTDAQIQKNNCQSSIDKYKNKIREYEKLYDSLNQFKNDVSYSQECFSSINSSKKKILEDISNVSNDCETAKKYADGMKKVVNGIGVAYVNVTYLALLWSVESKLKYYINQISICETKISVLENTIVALDRQIKDESMRE